MTKPFQVSSRFPSKSPELTSPPLGLTDLPLTTESTKSRDAPISAGAIDIFKFFFHPACPGPSSQTLM